MRRRNIEQITFCTGFWPIPGNQKRSYGHYLKYLSGTIKLIAGGKLLVFHDDPNFFKKCQDAANRYNVSICEYRISLTELQYYSIGEILLSSCKRMEGSKYLINRKFKKDKGVRHYQREYLISGEESYKNIMAIWMSKISLVTHHATSLNNFNTEKYAWIDISISRFKLLRTNWDFTKNNYESNKIYHYGTDSYYNGLPMKLNASFLLGSEHCWKVLDEKFDGALRDRMNDDYAHDEETVLSHVMQNNQNLFQSVGEMHRGVKRKIYRFIDARI